MLRSVIWQRLPRVLVSFLLAAIGGWGIWSGVQTYATQQTGRLPPREFGTPTPEQRRQQLLALREGGLRAAAAVTGVFVTAQGPVRGGEPATLAELIDLSHVVLVGWVADHSMALSRDGRSVVSEYAISIEAVLTGIEKTDRSGTVQVVMPGGRVSFPGGSLAQVDTPGFARPLNGRRYLLFLRTVDVEPSQVSDRTNKNAFSLTAGPLSVFDLTGNPRVKPAGSYASQLARRLWKENVSAEGLISKVRDLVGR